MLEFPHPPPMTTTAPLLLNEGPCSLPSVYMAAPHQGLLNLSLFIESEYTPVALICTQI